MVPVVGRQGWLRPGGGLPLLRLPSSPSAFLRRLLFGGSLRPRIAESDKAAKARRSSRVQQRSASPYGQFQASFWQWTPISGCKAAGLTMRRPRRVRPKPPQARPTRATALRKSTRRRMTAARRKAASQRMKTARTPGRQFRSSRGMPRTAAMRGTSEPWRDAATRM